MQSPKDTPIQTFEDADRPRSARLSDKPGNAFSGLRPRSFSRVRGSRSRVTSIEEEEIKTGTQPLVSHSLSGGFGRSESSIGAERTISSRRIAGSRSGDSEGRRRRSRSRSRSESSQGAGTVSAVAPAVEPPAVVQPAAIPPPAPVSTAPRHVSRNGDHLSSSPPMAEGERAQVLMRNHQASAGTGLSALDRAQSASRLRHLPQQQQQQQASGTAPGGSINISSSGRTLTTAPLPATAPQRRASIFGPETQATDGAAAFDSPPDESSGNKVPRRMTAAYPVRIATSGSMDLVTTIGTPAGIPEAGKTPVKRGLSRAMTERPGRAGFGQRGG